MSSHKVQNQEGEDEMHTERPRMIVWFGNWVGMQRERRKQRKRQRGSSKNIEEEEQDGE